MKILKTGDVFYGKNYADMINRAIGTNYASWRRSSVDLQDFGANGVIAWFVYMDGSEHGYEDGWKWANKLSLNGKEIDEYHISSSKVQLKKRRVEEGYHPYRLAFQRDPYGEDNPYCCKFVGVFRFLEFIRKDATAMTYEKVMDEFRLGSKGEYGAYLNSKDDLIPTKGLYTTPLSGMGFSDSTYKILSKAIKNAGELLELGIGLEGPLADEIQNRVYECFKNDSMI